MKKICFKCNQELPITEFYVHKQMGDGHLNKCKTCTKADAAAREAVLKTDPEWMESERVRARKKHAKYKYKNNQTPSEKRESIILNREKYPEKYKAKLACQRVKVLLGQERHHWSYNDIHYKDVIGLTKKVHAFVHRYMEYDQERMMYRVSSKFTDWDLGELLDTRERHEAFIQSCLSQKEF